MPPSVERPLLRAGGSVPANLVGRLHGILRESVQVRPWAALALVALALRVGRAELGRRTELVASGHELGVGGLREAPGVRANG
eukprot:15044053-Alexandrium_andersonii.AAC.1